MELTKSALQALRLNLTEPRTPTALKAFCDKLRLETSGKVFFNKGGLSFIREAIIAADFGAIRGASLVRLVPEVERRPYFELIFPDRTERFEQVEADRDGRRRGDDYEALAQMPTCYVHHVEVPSQEEVIEIVRRTARKKAKPYPAGTRLLIYLNLPRFPSDECLLASFPEAISEACPFFSAIWITWQGIPHQVCSAS